VVLLSAQRTSLVPELSGFNSQFVEAGVKAISLASKTGRHEEMRSVYCINRSSKELTSGVNRHTKATDKIAMLINSAIEKDKCHSDLLEELGKDRYNGAIEGIKQELMGDNHYKHERVEWLTKAITDNADNNKATNVRRTIGVDETAASRGLVADSKVSLTQGHLTHLVTELCHRGYDTSWS
jgi:hypothetical protein